MSKLIERQEHRHVNVTEQDQWQVREDDLHGPDTATLVLQMYAPDPGCIAGGRLYFKGMSVSKLTQLRGEIDRFLAGPADDACETAGKRIAAAR